jgi:hypothetical protein
MADSFEFMRTGECGKWGLLDRVWAFTGVSISLVFASLSNAQPFGVWCYAVGLALGFVAWFASVTILRTECNLPMTWAWLHILWHVLPSSGGVTLAFSLLPVPQNVTHIPF